MTLKKALGLATVTGLLLATPLAAEEAQVPASPGGVASAERSAPASGAMPVDEAILATLKSAKPMPVPTAPAGPATPLRMGSQRYQAKDFATVTKTLGGETVTTPPSEAIEKAIEETKELKAPAPTGQAPLKGAAEAAPVSPPGSQAEKKVFGRDDRVRIRGTSTYPYRVIGLLQMKFPGDGDLRFLCSGTLIDARKVLTAAHCLYDIERGLWPEEVLFFPGLDGNDAPFGYYPADRVEVLSGYVNAPTRVYDWQHVLHDMGIVRLSNQAGRELGTLGYGYNDGLPPFVGNIVGYPLDQPPGTMWRASCDIDTVQGYPDIFQTHCDTFQGSSGSGIYFYDRGSDDRIIYGVNVAENPQFNTGLRITGPYYLWIQQTLN